MRAACFPSPQGRRCTSMSAAHRRVPTRASTGVARATATAAAAVARPICGRPVMPSPTAYWSPLVAVAMVARMVARRMATMAVRVVVWRVRMARPSQHRTRHSSAVRVVRRRLAVPPVRTQAPVVVQARSATAARLVAPMVAVEVAATTVAVAATTTVVVVARRTPAA